MQLCRAVMVALVLVLALVAMNAEAQAHASTRTATRARAGVRGGAMATKTASAANAKATKLRGVRQHKPAASRAALASTLHAQAVREHHAPVHMTPVLDRLRRHLRVRRARVHAARHVVHDVLRAPIGLTEEEEGTCKRDFSAWMHTHRRVYRDGDDMTRRYEQYRANWKYISDWNTRQDKGGADAKDIAHLTFRLAANQFCDHSADEFAKRLGYRPANFPKAQAQTSAPAAPTRIPTATVASKVAVTGKTTAAEAGAAKAAKTQRFQSVEQVRQFPASGNWADDSTVVGPIRMQGVCGSCWSLAAATVVESASAILTGEFVANSAQHLLDCCRGADWWPNEGCNGGNMMTAYRYAQQSGVCAWDDYPYTGIAGTCKACAPVAWINGHTLVSVNGDESPIASAIASAGPVVVAITANVPTFQFYSSGVYNDVACPTTFDTLDHAVVLTGFGSVPASAATGGVEQPYWWLRNTWDVTWGEAGYMRLQRGTNLCGVASEVTQPIATRSADPAANALRQQLAQRAREAAAAATTASTTVTTNTPRAQAVPTAPDSADYASNQYAPSGGADAASPSVMAYQYDQQPPASSDAYQDQQPSDSQFQS